MIEHFWKDKYPAGVTADINPDEFPNIQAVLKQSCQRFADKPAFSNLGKTITYGELYALSGAFAAWLQQHTDLKPGDRVFILRLDEDGAAHVIFGDGIRGARLPTGQDNVEAIYRRGAGLAGHLEAGQLSLLAGKPQGLRGVTNPLPPAGGADAEALGVRVAEDLLKQGAGEILKAVYGEAGHP